MLKNTTLFSVVGFGSFPLPPSLLFFILPVWKSETILTSRELKANSNYRKKRAHLYLILPRAGKKMTKDANTDLHSESSLGKNICKLQQFADNLWVRGEGRREGKGLKPRCEELKATWAYKQS
jgi:hypothetical protein